MGREFPSFNLNQFVLGTRVVTYMLIYSAQTKKVKKFLFWARLKFLFLCEVGCVPNYALYKNVFFSCFVQASNNFFHPQFNQGICLHAW